MCAYANTSRSRPSGTDIAFEICAPMHQDSLRNPAKILSEKETPFKQMKTSHEVIPTSQHETAAGLADTKIFTDRALDSIVDFVVVTDLDLRITQINKAALRLNGYQRHELVGKSVNVLMADRPFSQKGVDILRKNGYALNIDKINLNKDGTTTPISRSLSVFKDEQGNDQGIVCVGRDVTERKRAEIERESIFEITQGISATSNIEALIELIHESIGKVLYAENCYVALVDPKTELLTMQFFVDKRDPVPPKAKLVVGPTRYIVRTGQPMLITP